MMSNIYFIIDKILTLNCQKSNYIYNILIMMLYRTSIEKKKKCLIILSITLTFTKEFEYINLNKNVYIRYMF